MVASKQQLTNRLSEGIAHHEAGRLDRAEAIYRQIATQAPRYAIVFELLGRVTEQQGRFDEAMRHFRQSLQLDPRSVSSAVQLASTLIATSRAADAEKVLRALTTQVPRSPDAWNALGYALKILGRLDEAIACHERAVTLNPKFAEGWLHWGLTLMFTGRNYEALEKQERALQLNPALTAARFGRAQALHKVYRTAEAIADYDAVIKAEPGNLQARSYRLFALQSLESRSPEQMFEAHRAYGDAVGRGQDRLPGYDFSPDKRLRVAILSPDFRVHSCAYFVEPLLRHLPGDQFEVFLYHDHFVEDEMSARLRGRSAAWRNFVGQSAATFERTVRADKPDILIDLTGHVGSTIRLPSFAKRLAPVQITYLGYPDTTGVPAMDYRLTDPIADPPGESDRWATEKLVRFAPVAWTYQPPLDAPPISALPMASGAGVTFGCFSAPTKFTDSLFRAWAQLLALVAGSRLVLKGGDFDQPDVRSSMLQRMARAGLPLERLELLPRTPDTASHLAQYARLDIALDTFPYTGTTTTCEALWMGRPVVTLLGNRHAARVGASLLTAIGRPDWIAHDVEDYVRIAAKLAQSGTALTVESAQLRSQIMNSPLLDHATQAERFAKALRCCWIERSAAKA